MVSALLSFADSRRMTHSSSLNRRKYMAKHMTSTTTGIFQVRIAYYSKHILN
jgi:hypothetical protein